MIKIVNYNNNWYLIFRKPMLLYIISASFLVSCSYKKNDVFADYRNQTIIVDVICTKELLEDLDLVLTQKVAERIKKQISKIEDRNNHAVWKEESQHLHLSGLEVITIRTIQEKCKKKGVILPKLNDETTDNNTHKTTQN